MMKVMQSWICFKLDLAFKYFSYWVFENETFENFFAKFSKEEEEGGSVQKISQTRQDLWMTLSNTREGRVCGFIFLDWKQVWDFMLCCPWKFPFVDP